MKRKHQWHRRLLCCFLAVAVLLGGLLCCLPVRAGAIVPLGFVQSALASYVSSTGYKLYNDNGTGQDILGSLGELYDDYVTVSNKTITGQLANLAFLANSPYIYQDNSGQIVVSKVAADIFQDFSDWIQTEYSVPVGSDTPTSVLQSSGGTDFTLPNGASGIIVHTSIPVNVSGFNIYYSDRAVGSYRGFPVYFSSSQPGSIYLCLTNTYIYFMQKSNPSYLRTIFYNGSSWEAFGIGTDMNSFDPGFWNYTRLSALTGITFELIPVSSVSPVGTDTTDSGAATGLAVTLAQAVADVVGQAKDDDAVVIGVGASAGATAQDIADMVAQGVKAQTLDPSVSITAEAVIDTPVQPYPDIDGLGLPTLGAALVSRFPFCVPWDFVDTLKILNADPIPPVFDVTLVPASVAARWGVSGNFTIHVDLTSQEYAKLFVALRWGTLVGFCLGLALLTKRLIWTA